VARFYGSRCRMIIQMEGASRGFSATADFLLFQFNACLYCLHQPFQETFSLHFRILLALFLSAVELLRCCRVRSLTWYAWQCCLYLSVCLSVTLVHCVETD